MYNKGYHFRVDIRIGVIIWVNIMWVISIRDGSSPRRLLTTEDYQGRIRVIRVIIRININIHERDASSLTRRITLPRSLLVTNGRVIRVIRVTFYESLFGSVWPASPFLTKLTLFLTSLSKLTTQPLLVPDISGLSGLLGLLGLSKGSLYDEMISINNPE